MEYSKNLDLFRYSLLQREYLNEVRGRDLILVL